MMMTSHRLRRGLAVTSLLVVGCVGCGSSNTDTSSAKTDTSNLEVSKHSGTSGGPATPGSGSAGAGRSGSGQTTSAPAAPTVNRGNQVSVLGSLPGSSSRRCAVVGNRADVRSHTLAAGNFEIARKQYARSKGLERPPVFVYVIPQHSSHLRKLTVRITQLRPAGKVRTVSSTSVQEADIWRYYAVNLPLGTAGTYRLSMTSGPDTGCFVVTFGS
jgi:hypothetical protein